KARAERSPPRPTRRHAARSPCAQSGGPGRGTPHARSRKRANAVSSLPGAFDGQRIIVTGGGSGIGRCTAHELASLGAFVALVGRNREKLDAVAAEISEAGYRPPTLHVCDI